MVGLRKVLQNGGDGVGDLVMGSLDGVASGWGGHIQCKTAFNLGSSNTLFDKVELSGLMEKSQHLFLMRSPTVLRYHTDG